jgi:hypothetical protein
MRKLKVLQRNEERRNCLKLIFSGLAVATGLPRTSAGSEAPPAEKALPALPEGESPLLRMQYELHARLKSPSNRAVGDGDRSAQMHRLLGLHGWLHRGESPPSGRGLSAGSGGGDR